MANLETNDFSLTIAAGYNNMKTLIEASASTTVNSYKWSMLAITNTGANACTIRRTPNSNTPAFTTDGRNVAAGSGFVFDARQGSYIDGSGVWVYSAAGTTIDVSIMHSGN